MWKLFPFNNYFLNVDRNYSIPEQWDLVKASGYDQFYLSVNCNSEESWQALQAIPEQRKRTGLGLAAVYTVVDFSILNNPDNPPAHRPEEILDILEPGDTFELALSFGWQKDLSDPARDKEAIEWLLRLLEKAKARDITLSLYHHLGFWQERIEDCVRIAEKINDPSLRVSFSGYHWYACDRKDLEAKLTLAKPWLHLVNLSGSRPAKGFANVLSATVEVVGEGEFPLHEFIKLLRKIGYEGSVGFQGFMLGGYPPITLPRSLENFKKAFAVAS